MLTETINIYTCEKCGLQIKDDYEKMIDHEYGHTAPSFQKPEASAYSTEYPYPFEVAIKMSNGAIVQYSNPIEVKPPIEVEPSTKKESPSETD